MGGRLGHFFAHGRNSVAQFRPREPFETLAATWLPALADLPMEAPPHGVPAVLDALTPLTANEPRGLRQPFLVEALLVGLVPLRLVGLGIGELALGAGARDGVLEARLLADGRIAARDGECDHDQGHDHDRDDDPGDHAGQPTAGKAALDDVEVDAGVLVRRARETGLDPRL